MRTYRRLCETLFAAGLIISLIVLINSFLTVNTNTNFNRNSINKLIPTQWSIIKQFTRNQINENISLVPFRYVIELNKTDALGQKLRLQSNGNVRRRFDLKIGIFTVVISRDQFYRYRMAFNSLECYAAYHKYKLEIIYESDMPHLNAKCPINDVS